jgi:hypothetical protein
MAKPKKNAAFRLPHHGERYINDYEPVEDPEDGRRTFRYCGIRYRWDVPGGQGRRRACCLALAIPMILLSVAMGLIRTASAQDVLTGTAYGISQGILIILVFRTVGVLLLGDSLERIEYERTKQTNGLSLAFALLASATALCWLVEYFRLPGRYVGTTDYIHGAGLFCTALAAWGFDRLLRHYRKLIIKEDDAARVPENTGE